MNNRYPSLVFAFLLGSSGFAQTINITGLVVDSASTQGIGGASVKLVEFPNVVTSTDANGSFTLSGSAASLTGESVGAGPGVLLQGNSLTLFARASAQPVVVDVFNSKGARVFHARRSLDGSGTLHLTHLWQGPGRYTVIVEYQGSRHVISGVDLNGNLRRFIDFHATEPKGPGLAKANAAMTLRVTASGYLMKNLSLTAIDTNAGTIALAKENEQTGVWTNVTPPGMTDSSGYGAGSIAGDPLRPSDLYIGGSQSGVWKSTNYGNTWVKINSLSPDVTRGNVIAVAATTPATLYIAGFHQIYKSVNAGVSFTTLPLNYDPYSLTIDPYDTQHLLSGLHEAAGVIESTDGGVSWHAAGSGSVGGGVSVYPFFINTGDSATTRKTWIAIAQNGSNPGRTTDGGATWSIPAGLSKLEHPHGNAQIFQTGSALFMGGLYGDSGQGVYKSADYGLNWKRIDSGNKPEAIVWGTEKNVYAMYAWACSGCDLGTNFEYAPLPAGSNWTYAATPGLIIGPNSLVVTHNGSHNVFVGLMWDEGLWRYVEP